MLNKIFIFVLIFGFASPSFTAEEKTVFFHKESYLPQSGSFFIVPLLSVSNSQSTLKSSAGKVADITRSITSLDLLGGYGLTDALSFGIKFKFYLSDKTDYNYGPGSTSSGTSETRKNKGFQDPEILSRLRIYENAISNTRINLLGGISPKLQTAKYSTATSDGNEANGRTEMKLGIELYKEIQNVEFSFGVQRRFYTGKKYESSADAKFISETSEYQSTDLQIGFTNFASENYNFGVTFNLNLTDKYSVDSLTGSQVTSTAFYNSGSGSYLSFNGKYLFTDKSALRLSYQTVINYSQSLKIGTVNVDQSETSISQINLAWLQEF